VEELWIVRKEEEEMTKVEKLRRLMPSRKRGFNGTETKYCRKEDKENMLPQMFGREEKNGFIDISM
jgi:hypothetical protein